MKPRSEYGLRLKQARELAKLSQKQLAARAGMSQGNLSELETNGQGSAMTLQLAAACGVDPRWLATGEGEPYAEATADDAPERLSPWPLERLRESTWRSLTERQKALLEDVMMTKLRELQAEENQADELPIGPRRKPRANGA